MRASWSALYQSLHRSLNRISVETAFQELRYRHPDVRPFASIPALLRYLQEVEGEPAGRYRVIRQLVVAAQTEEGPCPAAVTVVMVALWPGLDGVRRRLLRGFPDDAADLGSEVLARFSEAVMCLDPGRVRSVAGTLIRNVERDLRRDLIRVRMRDHRSFDISDPIVEAEVDRALSSRQPDADLGDHLAGLSRDSVALLTRVLVRGETQEEAGRTFGLGPAAARKRFQRCIRQLRDKAVGGCPVSRARSAFPKTQDRKGPGKGD